MVRFLADSDNVRGLSSALAYILWILLLGSIVTASVSTSEVDLFAGGTGEPDNPYRIATAEQLIRPG